MTGTYADIAAGRLLARDIRAAVRLLGPCPHDVYGDCGTCRMDEAAADTRTYLNPQGIARSLDILTGADRGGDDCPDATCSDGVHYSGRRHPETDEDIESGPCPLWTVPAVSVVEQSS